MSNGQDLKSEVGRGDLEPEGLRGWLVTSLSSDRRDTRGGDRFRVREILTKGTKETRGGEVQQRIRNAVLEPPAEKWI